MVDARHQGWPLACTISDGGPPDHSLLSED